MQPSLFSNQTEYVEPQESVGTKTKRAYAKEQKYQELKLEGQKTQKKWENSRTARKAFDDAERERRDQINQAAPITVVLVACVSRKADEPRPAQDLYTSDLFRKARRYAETHGDEWFILSALHGLVTPEEIIEPYNYTLCGKRKAERQEWASRTASSLRRRVPPQSRLIILAGEDYRGELIPLLSDRYQIEIPMLNLGIGQQLAYLKKANAAFADAQESAV